jgi:hypothetical protein
MTLALADLPSALIEFMAGAPARFGMRMAYEIYLYHKHVGPDPTLQLAARVLNEDLSVRDVERLRKRTTTQEAGSAKWHRYNHRYELLYRGVFVGVVKTYNTGEIEVQLTGFTAELQERFAQRLSEVLQEFEP